MHAWSERSRPPTAKTSVYRRWSSREAACPAIEVTRNATGFTIDLVERTSPQDFVKLLVEACEVVARPEIRQLMTRLIGSIPDCSKLIEIYRETYFLPRRRAFARVPERVQAAGLLAKDADLEALAEMIIGTMMYRLVMSASAPSSVSELRDHVIKLLRQAGFEVPM
jgi:hypothetical protein